MQAEAIEIGTAEDTRAFEPELVELCNETEAVAPYAFLATDFKHNTERNEAAHDVVAHVLGMECMLGKDYPTDQLREAIVAKIIGPIWSSPISPASPMTLAKTATELEHLHRSRHRNGSTAAGLRDRAGSGELQSGSEG